MPVRRSLYITATAGGVGTTAVDARIDQAALFTPNGDLGVVAGIISGLVVTGTASGWAYQVTKGHGLTTRGETDGACLLAVDGTTTTPAPVLENGTAGTTSGPVSGSRYELICLLQRDLDAQETDNNAALVVVQGAASGSPTRPVAPVGAAVLYEAVVPAGAANTAAAGVTLTRVAPKVGLRGGIIPVTSASQRDQLTPYATATSPLYIDRLDTGALERNAGSGWVIVGGTPPVPVAVPFTANWANFSGSPGPGPAQSIKHADTTVTLHGAAIRAGTSPSASSATVGTLSTHRPARDEYFTVSTTGGPATLLVEAATGNLVVSWATAQTLTAGTYRVSLGGCQWVPA